MTDEPVVHLQDVTRTFEKGVGVRHLDLQVAAGTCLALIGPNGAGKTTTLRLVMGMLRPDQGRVRVFGADPVAHPVAVKQRIGYVAEDQRLPTDVRALDLFSLFADLYPAWNRDREAELVDRLELPLYRPLGRLSTGQRRQAALVCALAHEPALLVLDEPAGGLDPLVRRSFLENVIEMLGAAGTTVLFSSHQLDQVERLADRVAFLDRGGLLLEDDATRLREDAVQLLVEGLEEPEAGELDACLAVRPTGGRLALTFLATPEQARRTVEEREGARVVQTRGLGLEDLFVDLLRRRR